MKSIMYVRWEYAKWFAGKISRRPALEQALFINIQGMCMMNGGEFVADEPNLLDMADRLGSTLDDIRKALKNMVDRRIIERDHQTCHIKFISEQTDKMHKVSESRRIAARKRWNANACNPDASAMQTDANLIEKDKDKDKDKDKEKEKEKNKGTKRAQVDYEDPEIEMLLLMQDGWDTAWNAWKENRKAKGARATKYTKTLILKTLAKRPDEAVNGLNEAIERNWTGFKWSWYDNSNADESLSMKQSEDMIKAEIQREKDEKARKRAEADAEAKRVFEEMRQMEEAERAM